LNGDKVLSQILDKATKELSEAINIIWSEKTLEANLEKIKNDPALKEIKRKIDLTQELLLELQICLERFETAIATSFYWLEPLFLRGTP